MTPRSVQSQARSAARPYVMLWSALCLVLATSSMSVSWALAQNIATTTYSAASGTRSASPAVAAAKPAPVVMTKPAWQDLTSQQQVALRPLAANWATLPESNKRKWLAVSKNYSSLAPAEQTKMHSRMAEWVNLSQRQRTEARLQYAQTKQLTPAEKAATWQAYQALSPEEKQKLAAKATAKPVGAAPASKPVPPQKLAVVPVTRKTPSRSAKVAIAKDAVDQKTLLPRTQTASEPAGTQSH